MSIPSLRSIGLLVLAISSVFPVEAAAQPPARGERVEFNRDIRPILSDKCFTCHGPDAAKRQANLRLDVRDAAVAERNGGARAFFPQNSQSSEALRRVMSNDPEVVMPPPKSGPKLSPREIALLKKWLDDGAEYQPHWAFIAPHAVVPPDTKQERNARGPVDRFILSRLDREQLTASPEADRPTLLRRVSFDLTGLPPAPEEVDAFVADPSPDAFERQIDRLLASPRLGERMATIWLDAARYADTNGYQTDGPRFMWRYRDWVIDAYNRNQPFDEFTIHQLAGDLLPRDGTLVVADDRLIATGFNRNHRGNAEGGIIPEEFRVEYVVDRVETTSTVWLGLTIGCARCHDHKYDPVSQREFYQLFDFFNRVPEPGKYIRNSNSMPYLPAPTVDQQRTLASLQHEVDRAGTRWKELAPVVRDGISRMCDRLRSQPNLDWVSDAGLETHASFDGGNEITRIGANANGEKKEGESKNLATGTWHDGDAKFAAGRIGQAAEFDGRRWFDAGTSGDFGEAESFVLSCWVKPQPPANGRKAMTILARMDHENASRGYELRLEESGRLQALFSGRILDDLIRVETKQSLPDDRWSHVLVSYDGSSAARGVAIRINGIKEELTVVIDLLSNPIRVKLPLIIGAGGSAALFQGQIDDLRFYRGRIIDDVALSLAAGDSLSAMAAAGLSDKTSPLHFAKLHEYYLNHHAPESERRARQDVLDARLRYETYLATIPTTMVMQDVAGLRETRILKRGEYDKPGEPVRPQVPATLPALQSEGPLNRLDLARWLVAPDHPLTARVTVNRHWQMLFGIGLVKTVEDFGVQGELPSHPELLDWLAIELRCGPKADWQRAWDTKRMLRLLASSAAYRQTARGTEGLLARDPENRLLARGPRFRLTAEMIRDAALLSSGLLVESLGGPSVKPYQPPGLWEELSADTVPGPFSIYVQDHGASLYRRSLYTYQRRTVTTPGMAIFDASSRDFCRVKLPRTNTPLQALNLMNDVTYLEAARVLAETALHQQGPTVAARLTWAFRRIVSRDPTDAELQALLAGHDRRLSRFRANPTTAKQLLSAGESSPDQTLDPTETAALSATLSVIYNLDEAASR